MIERVAERCWFLFLILTTVCVISLGGVVASIGAGHRARPPVTHRPLVRVATGLLGLTGALLFALFLARPKPAALESDEATRWTKGGAA